MKLWWIVFVLSFLGCSSLQYVVRPRATVSLEIVEIQTDKNFSDEDRGRINEAVESWNKSLNGYMELQIVNREFDMRPEELRRGGIIIMKVTSDNPIVPDKGSRVMGWTNEVGGGLIWIVRDRVWDGQVVGVVMQELGHSLGSKHLGTSSLMYKYDGGRSKCVDKETATEIARIHHWDVEHMEWCE